jgi:acyl-[acyl-carrier-protein]-phospholipid O-acyltransferase / long-chain-fatty-acid--[acyl-carrier-protein] ligase
MKTLILVLRWLLRLLFRFKAYNTEVLKTPGPVLLIPNHVSWIDWLFIGVLLEDDWRFVTSSTTAETTWIHRKIMVNSQTFPVDTNSPYAARRMAEYLAAGGRLVLFPEGRLTLTGALMKVFEGTGFLVHRTDAKIITCYLRGINRVRWVRHTGWRKWFPTVTAHFSEVQKGPKMPDVKRTIARRRLTTWVRELMVRQQFEVEQAFGEPNLIAAVVETARNIPGKAILEDMTFKKLSYRRVMVAVDLLGQQWKARLGGGQPGDCTEKVGVLLPNVNATPLTVMSLWLAGYVPAMLNFSSGPAVMLACIRLAGLKRVVTSRKFLEKAKLDLSALSEAGVELVYLEDIGAGIHSLDRILGLIRHYWKCGKGVEIPLPRSESAGATAVVLFTSGSEGIPKGVELSHRNLLANIRQALAMLDFTDDEKIFNALPLFHSFGLTVCTLLPLVRGNYLFLYPSPLHYRVLPEAMYDRACTVMVGTNTFLTGYAKKANPYDFNSVKYLVSGGERLQESNSTLWAQKFGLRIMEGYGATECSPVISVTTRVDPKVGSVGRLLPGIEAKLEVVEGIAEGGRLLVRGPNVMKGYLNSEANEKFQALGGWYDTGDIVRIDEDGFLFVLGRLKRFAKVSGEMISLTAVEDSLAGAFPHYGPRFEVAVISRHDDDKGEALIAVTTESRLTPDEIRGVIRGKGMTNLSVPRELVLISEIPKLGTGKVDYRELSKRVIG